MKKYPSVTKIIWETKSKEERERIESFSKEEFKEYGIKSHREIEVNNSIDFNDNLIDISLKYGQPLYKEKFLKCNRHKYCGKIDYINKEFSIIEWKFINSDKNLDKKMDDYHLQLGAYYNLVRRFKKVSAKLIIFIRDTGEIKEFFYSKVDLIYFKKEFIKRLKIYYGNYR